MTAGTDPVLVVTGPTAQPFALSKDETTVGRSPDRDIHLNDNEVSRSHAVLTRRGGSTFLTDLGSRNGTYINGAPVKGTVELRDGDLISFASVQAIFHSALVRGAVRPPVVPDQPTPQPFGLEPPDDLISTLPPRSTAEPHHPSRSDPPTDQGLGPPGSHPGGPAMQPGPLPPAHGAGAPPVQPPVSDPGSAPQDPGAAGPAVQAAGGPPAGQPPEAALEQVGGPPVLLTLAETRIGRVPGNDVVVP
ncbi:MAG: FHA domain-containing protein, partial [Chloroflexi bacterium]|nr:FHA domain-containing protein [Chloroflexota bacterium]